MEKILFFVIWLCLLIYVIYSFVFGFEEQYQTNMKGHLMITPTPVSEYLTSDHWTPIRN
jgi:hypothetical protein